MAAKTTEPKPKEPTEIIAEELVKISEGIRKIRTGQLNEKAIVVLLQSSTQLPQNTIKLVLNGLENLKADYIQKPKVTP